VLLATLGCALFAGAADAGPPVTAHSARTLTLKESARLRLTSKHGVTLTEMGAASGTIPGTIYIHLHFVSSSRVIAEVSIYPRGGSLSGSGSASYRVQGAFAAFSGTLAVTRGTGSYGHAHASSLRFLGIIARHTDAVAVQLSGRCERPCQVAALAAGLALASM
jgi:hypothetical protein